MDDVYNEGLPVWIRGVEWHRQEDSYVLDLHVAPLVSPTGELVGCTVNATDVTRYTQLRDEIAVAKRELETAYEELQSSNEELETTNEELQSTNEELETTNEELQSTNEELETMNEELQSTNEELETINDELQQRTEEIDEAAAFLESVLESLASAMIVVDRDYGIRAWNQAAYDLWGLRPDEVLGRHLLTLDIGLPVGDLRQPIAEVIASGEPSEATVGALTRRGRAVDCRVELAPLGNHDRSAIRGAILTMRTSHPAAS
jgi:two-component system CheB/CheR fusion protein